MSDKSNIRERVILKEEAVFWMDERGRWCNQHGPFEHPKIIAYFNAAIRKDHNGYFVEQFIDGLREKVYFRHYDTPLFIIDVSDREPVILTLNTGRAVELAPEQLFIREDHLYMNLKDEFAKFSESALMRMAQWIQYDHDRAFFRKSQVRVEIPED